MTPVLMGRRRDSRSGTRVRVFIEPYLALWFRYETTLMTNLSVFGNYIEFDQLSIVLNVIKLVG